MADTPLSAQMEDEYKVSKWNRNTVADGTWLQKYTIEKLNDRDIFLANAIDNNGDDIREALNQEIETRTNDDIIISAALTGVSGDFYTFSANVENSASTIVNNIETFSSYVESSAAALDQKINNESNRAQDRENELASKIDTLEAATDVIMVYGTYQDFINTSAELWEVSAGYLTENDVVKVLIDDSQGNSANQTYYQAKNVDYDTSSCTWTKIGELDPYYNTAQIDEYFNMLSGTIADNYLSANENAVSAGKNIQIIYDENKPKININTKADVEFTTVSSTNISSTNVTALTATGNSAKFTNLSATNLNNVSISNLFNSAYSGAEASAYITSHSGDFLNSAHNAYNKLTFNFGSTTKDYQANSSAYSFTFNAGNAINFVTGTNQITISSNDTTYQGSTYISTANNIISVTDDLIGSAESGNLAWKALTGAKWKADTTNMGDISAGFTLSAGTGVGFNKNYTNHILTISAEGKTYAAGDYISITGTTNKINVTGTLINSAQSGQSAYNWITTKSATLQAGQGIGFYSAGPNILGISAEGTKVSAGGNIQNPTEYTTNVNLSAGGGVQFVTADNNVLGIKTTTMEYSPLDYSTYYDMTSFKINAVSVQGTNQLESVVMVNDRVYGFLMPDPVPSDELRIPVARYANGRGYYYLDNVTAAVGNYVSAANQQKITVATATTLPSPASMENGVYYIV